MNRRWFLVLLLAFCGARLAVLRAHEGHVHRIMGTVLAIHENHVEVKATNGNTSMIRLNEKTRILRGKTVMKPADITEGIRVVVAATEVKGKDGRMSLVANQVMLGTAAPAKK